MSPDGMSEMEPVPKADLKRAVLSSCWGVFVVFLSYKARRKGNLVIKVPPHYSFQECSRCGIGKEKQLGQDACVKASGEDNKTRKPKRLRASSAKKERLILRSETPTTASA